MILNNRPNVNDDFPLKLSDLREINKSYFSNFDLFVSIFLSFFNKFILFLKQILSNNT